MDERFETFTVLINQISRSIRRIKAEQMESINLKGPHVSCLYYLTKSQTCNGGFLKRISYRMGTIYRVIRVA